ncbi:MAG: hypothetical protein ACUZ8E_07255 [Candidatus Anammoxibacter sp.]
MPVGGDIIEITFNHPTVGSGTIYPKSTEDSTFNLGGFRSEDDMAKIAGDGSMIDTINRVRWSFEVPATWDQNSANELDKLIELAESPVESTWTISSINGTVWGGKGKPVGELPGNGNAATITLKLSGGGRLKKIVG